MAKRIVGEAVVRMTYVDARNWYRCSILVNDAVVYRCNVGLPRSTGHFNDLGLGIGVAVDAPEAYDFTDMVDECISKLNEQLEELEKKLS